MLNTLDWEIFIVQKCLCFILYEINALIIFYNKKLALNNNYGHQFNVCHLCMFTEYFYSMYNLFIFDIHTDSLSRDDLCTP